MAKSCTSVFLAGNWDKFLSVYVQTLLLYRMYRLATKRTRKKRLEENANVSLRQRKPRFIAHYLLLRTWEDWHRELFSSRLSGLSLDAFIIPNRKKWIAYQPFCNPFILHTGWTFWHLLHAVPWVSQQQLSFLYVSDHKCIQSVICCHIMIAIAPDHNWVYLLLINK